MGTILTHAEGWADAIDSASASVEECGCRNEHAHHLKGEQATDVNGQATDQKINLRAALESRTPDLRITRDPKAAHCVLLRTESLGKGCMIAQGIQGVAPRL